MIICPIDVSPFSYSDVIKLLHLAFSERIEQGLMFTSFFLSEESFISLMKDGTVLVAYDEQSNNLLGTLSCHIKKDSRERQFGYFEHLAVHPMLKRSGVGSSLFSYQLQYLKSSGVDYVISDTAVGALSSLHFHLRNGFLKWGLVSFPSTNYYSYVFRKQLNYNNLRDRFIGSRIFAFSRFILSSIFTRIVWDENGDTTKLGGLIYKIVYG